MNLILENENIKLIKKYDNYYIRFIGGQREEYPCDLAITQDEADKIINNKELIKDIRDSYKNKISWTLEYFVDSFLRTFMTFEYSMSEKRINIALDKLNRHMDIKMELYESLIYECFPKSGAIKELNYSACDIHEATSLTVLGAYNYLIYLREDPQSALNDLKKGLPRK